MIAEPSPTRFANPLLRYFAATRPAFLSVTFLACLIGLATAVHDGIAIDPWRAALLTLSALLAHAGVNVLNDYYDALSGADAGNTGRLFPFTGGSRFIQNGVLGLTDTRQFGYALLLCVAAPGLWLMLNTAPGLLLIGAGGLLIGWAYSAPPLKLVNRGAGELAIVACWLLAILGADYVQRAAFDTLPLAAGFSFALLVAAILYINQFPDCASDEAAGKRTLVVRLGPARASWGYLVLVLGAYTALALLWLARQIPDLALLALLPLPLSLLAARQLLRHARHPAHLLPAIRQTLLATHVHGFLLAGALLSSPLLEFRP